MITQNALLAQAATLVEEAQGIVALSGAGISTPSGIPDFRSPDSGVWENVDQLQVATIAGFEQDPQPFYDWIYALAKTVTAAQPNAAHLALAQMEATRRLTCVITQNIDALHTKAGSQVVHEIHGHLREVICMDCRRITESSRVMLRFMETAEVPICSSCGGVLKPQVVLYGELLPEGLLQKAQHAAQLCDLMIVAGSSLEVFPVNELPLLAKRNGAGLIFVNYSETPLDYLADVVIHANVVEILPELAAVLTTNRSDSARED